jgi:hypothetical protein
MLNLDQVTLLCIENRSPELAMFAINKCTQGIHFKKVVLATDLTIPYAYPSNIELVQAPEIKTTKDYSDYLLSDLSSLIEGTHVLVIQWDSFIVNPELWDTNYLKYDYIGAPWPHHPQTPVGNGGFSLRSIKLIKALQDKRILKRHPEDQAICIDNKLLLEEDFGIKFAPLELAHQFAIERGEWRESFGFHGLFNFAKVLNEVELSQFIRLIPTIFLGGQDTYELIEDLIKKGQLTNAKNLLNLSKPKLERKHRFHRMHIKLWIKLQFASLSSPNTR